MRLNFHWCGIVFSFVSDRSIESFHRLGCSSLPAAVIRRFLRGAIPVLADPAHARCDYHKTQSGLEQLHIGHISSGWVRMTAVPPWRPSAGQMTLAVRAGFGRRAPSMTIA
jgi:hypothetical protein